MTLRSPKQFIEEETTRAISRNARISLIALRDDEIAKELRELKHDFGCRRAIELLTEQL
jgi:hypothetical protein